MNVTPPSRSTAPLPRPLKAGAAHCNSSNSTLTMIHPINIEADLLTANPKRPQLMELRTKPKITYSSNGRRLRDGKPTTPVTSSQLWANTFLRSFARRLATEAEAMSAEESTDSFVDIVDLKPGQRSRASSTSSGSSVSSDDRPHLLTDRPDFQNDDIIQATVQMGPQAKAPSKKLLRRTSSKVPKNVVEQLIKPCCSALKDGFKEFLRIDFANAPLLKEASDKILTPRSVGSRVWMKEDGPSGTTKPALGFQMNSVKEQNKILYITVDCYNSFDGSVRLEVIMHVHVASVQDSQLLLEKPLPSLELASGHQSIEFEVEITERMRVTSDGEFVVIGLHGHSTVVSEQ
ncbi:unnamed protein product [Bursaphelenchus okinawaensis]|uniref:Uncharacterized protein n=1 Tax=Bursaphelenchus okinawaensis TaxID=465554 RepID=A0A811JSN2_9BILA|nr:unnamed protein product [Bursaphelenchus okinawaensis]CAG9081408.1 unnamed protein product [Bursaphelenchus okinawaensis]